MKYLIFSDLHGSSYYAKKVIDKFNEFNCDMILCLGDVLYHGPRNDLPEAYNPKEVFSLLNQYKDKIICVKGNCDAEVDQMVLDFKILDEYNLNINGKEIYLCHGHHLNFDGDNKNGIVLYGHTHVYEDRELNGVRYINPGSTSIPKNGCKNSFAVMDDEKIVVYDFDMNVLLNAKIK